MWSWCATFLLVLTLALDVTVLQVGAADSPSRTIRVVMDDNYPPFSFKDAEGRLKGILPDQWRLWEQKSGIHVTLSAMDWAEAQRRMKAGEFDVIDTIFRNEQREKIYDFTKPYVSLDVPLYFRSDISGISDIKDAKDFVVGVKAGGNVIGVLKSRGINNLIEFKSYEAIIAAARDHKINVFTMEKIPAHYFLYKFEIYDKFRETDPFYTGQFHRAVHKGNRDLLETLEKGFNAIPPVDYEKIEKRWYGLPLLTPSMLRHVGIGICLAVAVIAGLFLWLWMLRRVVVQRTADLSKTIQELDYQKNLISSVINGTTDAIFAKDAAGRYILVNNEVQRVFNKPAEEIIGKNDTSFFLPEEVKDLMASDREIMMLDGPQTREEELTTVDGNRIYQATKGPLRDNQGKVIGLFGVARDITEKKRLEKILEQKLDLLTNPVDQSGPISFNDLFNMKEIQKIQDSFALATGVASIITDTNGQPITEPSNFCNLCKNIIRKTEKGLANCRRSHEMVSRKNLDGAIQHPCLSGGLMDGGAAIHVGGQHIANWLVGQVLDASYDMDAMMAYAREIGANEEEYQKSLMQVPRMPREQFKNVCSALFQIAGQLSGMAMQNVNQAQYIAERKQAEDAQRHLEEQLRQSQKMEAVGQLAGGVAHDFNNILQVIMGYSSILLQKLAPNDPSRQAAEQILSSSEKAAQLTKGLLAFSRKQIMDPKVVNLNDIVRQVQSFLVRIIGEDIQFKTIQNEVDLPVRVDKGQIEQILINLATNARDAMPKGGMLTIETGQQETEAQPEDENIQSGRYACIALSDTGIGMSEETRLKIFEPFFTTKGVGKGTGLGMAIVYGIVRQHNGFMEVSSEPGLGSTFRIYFPIVETAQEIQEKPLHFSPRRGSETIMVAEDDAAVRQLIVSVLTSYGYEVIEAGDGQEAIDTFIANSNSIHLILMDMIMPKKNGKEAYEEINRLQPGVKVLYASGYTADFIQDRGVHEEGIDLLMKPVLPADLLKKVREMLDS